MRFRKQMIKKKKANETIIIADLRSKKINTAPFRPRLVVEHGNAFRTWIH